jgi:hypothetical protein
MLGIWNYASTPSLLSRFCRYRHYGFGTTAEVLLQLLVDVWLLNGKSLLLPVGSTGLLAGDGYKTLNSLGLIDLAGLLVLIRST